MRFTIDQRFIASPAAVAGAYADPAFYASFDDLPRLSRPEVLSHEINGDEIELRIRYRFSGQLSPAARAALDPARLTWVEHSTHDLRKRSTTFRMVPDNYADRFRCSGSYRFDEDGTGTRRHCEGDIQVRALLVGGAVENAIVSGLREHLAEEIAIVEAFVSG